MGARRFGIDAPKTLDFKLGDGTKVYHIPLAGSMPMRLMQRFANIASLPEAAQNSEALSIQLDILAQYCGQEVADTVTAETCNAIFEAWQEASDDAGEPAGE